MDKETIENKVGRIAAEVDPCRVGAYCMDEDDRYDIGFVAEVVKKVLVEEREACAVLAEKEGHYQCEGAQDTAKNIAELIRARSEP